MKDEFTFNQDQFIHMLDSKGIKLKCPICHKTPHALAPDINNNAYLAIPVGTGKIPKEPLGYIYAIGLVCMNCGHISHFSGNFIQGFVDDLIKH